MRPRRRGTCWGTWNANQPLPVGGFDYDPRIANSNYFTTGGAAASGWNPYYYQTAGTATTAQPAAQFSPYPGYAAISQYNTRQDQNWNALELSLKHPVTTDLFFTVAYTYSHDLTNYTSANSALGTFNVVDPYHPSRYYGNAEGLDFRHSVGITAIYNLPIFQHGSGLVHNTLGGWRLSDITTLRSGTAITPSITSSFQGGTVRPNRVAGQDHKRPEDRVAVVQHRSVYAGFGPQQRRQSADWFLRQRWNGFYPRPRIGGL